VAPTRQPQVTGARGKRAGWAAGAAGLGCNEQRVAAGRIKGARADFTGKRAAAHTGWDGGGGGLR
jgi:hypothetical protein